MTAIKEMSDRENIFSVILLAGDRISDELAKSSPRDRKALLTVGGQPMILHILNTLVSTTRVGSITIVGNRVQEIENYPLVGEWCSSRGHPDRINFVEGEKSPATSVVAILKALSLPFPVLVTTADSPLLTIETLDAFCDQALSLDGADVAVGLANEQDIRVAFPSSRRTFIRLGGQGYSGCNLFALMSGESSRAAEIWCDVERKRKRPWQLVSYFGMTTLFKALLGRLDLDSAFSAVSRFMKLNVKAVVLRDPEAAMDVDRLEHIAIVDDVLLKRKGAPATMRP